MSDDVLAKLKGLCDEVRARIEATPDYKALMAVERALGEVKGLIPESLPAAAAEDTAAVEAVAVADNDEAAAVTDDAAETMAEAVSEAVEPIAEPAAEAAPSEPDAAADAEPVVEGAAETTMEEASTTTVEASEAEPAAGEPVAETAAPEIPAEDRALVAELVAVAEVAANGTASTTP